MSKNSFSGNLIANEILNGRSEKTLDKNTIKVTIVTSETGTLQIYQSIDGKTFDNYDGVYTIASNSHKQVAVKGKYYYVRYQNGNDPVSDFKLYTTLTNILNNEFDVKLTNDDIVTVEGLNFDGSGNLRVTGIYDSGSGGDASSQNQLTQIEKAEIANTELTDIKTAVQGTLTTTVDNMIDVSGLATQGTLEQLNTTAEDISLKLLIPERSFAQVDFDTQSGQLVQGSGTWRIPLTGQNGWEYLNSTVGGATLYFYSNTPLTAGNFGLESDITLGSLTNMFFIGNFRALTANNPNRKFYLAVYTKPTGTNDFQPWYHSVKVWQLPNTAITSKGVDSFYYSGLDISTIFQEYDHIPYELALQNGECGADEIIQFMSLNVDSETPANNFDGIVKYAGFSAGGTNRVIKFEHSSREKVATDNLRALTVSDGKLNVNTTLTSQIINIHSASLGISTSTSSADLGDYKTIDLFLNYTSYSSGFLNVEFSYDNIDWYYSHRYAINSETKKVRFSLGQVGSKYIRLRTDELLSFSSLIAKVQIKE